MTRFEFYSKCAIMLSITCVMVYFSDTEKDMDHNVKWFFATITACVLWRDIPCLPKFRKENQQ